MDRRLLRLARGDGSADLVPAAAEALLLVEYEADGAAEAQALARDLIDRFRQADRPLLALTASDPDEIDRFWSVREAALSSLAALRGADRPVAVVEDAAVPAELLPEYLRRVQEVLQRREMVATYLIHAATGQVDMRPFLDLRRQEDGARLWALAEEVYDLVLEMGGTISGRNGTGLARSPWVSRQYGRLYPVFRELKSVFDPRRVFNPGKIVGPVPGSLVWPFRKAASGEWRVASEDQGAPEGAAEDVLPRHSPLATRRPSTSLAAGRRCARGGELQRLRTLPHRGAVAPDVPHLPGHARRGRHAAGQGQSHAPPPPAGRRPHADGVGRGAGRRRPVRQLQDVRGRVPRPRQRPPAHAGGQGRQHGPPRPGPRRLGHGAHRIVRPLRQRPRPVRQRPALQPRPSAGSWKNYSAYRAGGGCRPSPPGVFFARPGGAAGRAGRAPPGRASPTSWTCSPTTTTRRLPRR